jgi:arylsulfatase A-like enzyme
MLALGPGIRQNVVVDRPVQSVDLVPTLGALLGFASPYSQGKALTEVL